MGIALKLEDSPQQEFSRTELTTRWGMDRIFCPYMVRSCRKKYTLLL